MSQNIMKMMVMTDSNFQLPGYYSFYLVRRAMYFLAGTFSYEFRKDLPVSFKAFECLCLKDKNKNLENIVLNLVYRSSNVDLKELKKYFKSSLSK